MRSSLFAPKGRYTDPYGVCGECGKKFADESIRDHMVEQHGYMRVGAQVFKRVLCQFKECGAPGLYKVGVHVSCGAHREALSKLALVRSDSYDAGVGSRIENHNTVREKQQREVDSLNKMKGTLRPQLRSA